MEECCDVGAGDEVALHAVLLRVLLGVLIDVLHDALEAIVDTVLADTSTTQAQADFKAGQEKVIGFIVGQVMQASKGKANPAVVQQILRQKLA